VNFLIITIYSTTTCPYCRLLKEYLEEKGTDFTEKLIDVDEDARQQMEKESGGFLGVPFVVINKDDGTKETVVGFDKGRINQVLGLD